MKIRVTYNDERELPDEIIDVNWPNSPRVHEFVQIRKLHYRVEAVGYYHNTNEPDVIVFLVLKYHQWKTPDIQWLKDHPDWNQS